MRIARLVLVLALATVGCAAEAPKPAAGPPGPFDGTYTGTATLSAAKAQDCDATQQRKLVIVSNQGSLDYSSTVGMLTGAVSADGGVSLSGGRVGRPPTVLAGKIEGNTFT